MKSFDEILLETLNEDDKSHWQRKTVSSALPTVAPIVLGTLKGISGAANSAGFQAAVAKKINLSHVAISGLAPAAYTMVPPLLAWSIYRGIRSLMDSCTKQCGTFKLNDIKRQICMSKCRVSALDKAINITKSSISKETNQNNKMKLKKILDKQIKTKKQLDAKLVDYDHYVHPKKYK